MKGIIRTNEKCPECGGKFIDFDNRILACENCITKIKIVIPKNYYIDIYHHKKYKIYNDNDGEKLTSYERAYRLLVEINQKIRKKNYTFNINDYLIKSYKKLQFKEYAKKWVSIYEIKYSNGNLSLSRYNEIERHCRLYFIPFFKCHDIREIYEGDIEDFYLQLPKKFKNSTKKGIMSTLHSLFIDARRRRDIKEIPNFPRIEVEETTINWIDEETQDLILKYIPDHHKSIFLFLMRQGVRPGEVRALYWEDVDWKNRTVTIHRTFYKQYLKTRTKAKNIRTIPLDNDVYDTLLKMRGIAGLVFTLRGKQYGNERLGTIWKKALKIANMPHFPLYHGTRHSVASQAINRGVSREQVGVFLGHINYMTTKQYAHMNVQGLKPVLRAKVKKMKHNKTNS